MKKILFIYIVLISFFSTTIFAQVGVGTASPDKSAALDIDVSTLSNTNKKGLLLPRVNLLHKTDVTTISQPAEGLVVYNLQDSNNGGDVNTAVFKDTFYFWDGTKWLDITTIDVVKRELLPQVFFIVDNINQVIEGANLANVVVLWNPKGTDHSAIKINTGNNISLNTATNDFKINTTGEYEVAGTIVINPSLSATSTTKLEYIIQRSSDNGGTWTDLAKNTGVWGTGTAANSRTLIIAPLVITLNKSDLIRCVVNSPAKNLNSGSKIYPATNFSHSRTLRLQYLN